MRLSVVSHGAHMCVAKACAARTARTWATDVCCRHMQTCVLRRGFCCDLAACRFFAHARKDTHAHAHTCLQCKQRTKAVVSTRVLQKQGIRGHASSCLDSGSACACAQPPVCCRRKGLRPRCRKWFCCDVRTFDVAQRCVSGSRNPWSRIRFVGSVGCLSHRDVYGVVVIARGRSREPVVSMM